MIWAGGGSQCFCLDSKKNVLKSTRIKEVWLYFSRFAWAMSIFLWNSEVCRYTDGLSSKVVKPVFVFANESSESALEESDLMTKISSFS